MTTASDITAATTAIAAVVDFPTTKTALTSLVTVLNDLNAAITLLQTFRNDSYSNVKPTDRYTNGSEIALPYTGYPMASVALPSNVVGSIYSAMSFVTGARLPTNTHAVAYSTTVAAAGGVPGDSYTYSIGAGTSLPSGLSINASTGVISGTVAAVPTPSLVEFIVTVQDQHGNATSKWFGIQVV